MRARYLIVAAAILTCASCQATAPRAAGSSGDAFARLLPLLSGEFDNHEQVQRGAGEARSGVAIAPARVHHSWRVVEQGRDSALLLWVVRSADHSATWLYRISAAPDRLLLTPYRATAPAAVAAELADAKQAFRFDAAQWVALDPCAQSGIWEKDAFVASTNGAACSALLPGLGESAALLPLEIRLEGDLLRTATFADRARGAGAIEEARRVRWFGGWAAINGGGPQAKTANQDWHMQRDLHLASEGGRVSLHWRDGAASGYALELERRTYSERHLAVLQLNVIEEATGRTLTYAWTDPKSSAIGFNIGWLQVGLDEQSAAAK